MLKVILLIGLFVYIVSTFIVLEVNILKIEEIKGACPRWV